MTVYPLLLCLLVCSTLVRAAPGSDQIPEHVKWSDFPFEIAPEKRAPSTVEVSKLEKDSVVGEEETELVLPSGSGNQNGKTVYVVSKDQPVVPSVVSDGEQDSVAPSIAEKDEEKHDSSEPVVKGSTASEGMEIRQEDEGQGTRVIFVPPQRLGTLRYASFEPFIELERPLPLDIVDDNEQALPDKRSFAGFI